MIARTALALITLYQHTLGLLFAGSCRFHPSCSRYTASCIEHHGALRGAWLGARRIARCNPFTTGGYDPPPLPPAVPAALPPGTEPSPPSGSLRTLRNPLIGTRRAG